MTFLGEEIREIKNGEKSRDTVFKMRGYFFMEYIHIFVIVFNMEHIKKICVFKGNYLKGQNLKIFIKQLLLVPFEQPWII